MARGEDFQAAYLGFCRHPSIKDLEREPLDRRYRGAAAVRLLEVTRIRVGNRAYTRRSGARGLTTLTREHVGLGNTRAIYRKYYIHPVFIALFEQGKLCEAMTAAESVTVPTGLQPEEAVVFAALQQRGPVSSEE